jgi:hypothetical protein
MAGTINISEVVTSFYSDLKTVAADLNAASDELGKCIAEIDDGLKTLNLGITVWVEIDKWHGDFGGGDETYWSEEIGYSKWCGRWGICLRKTYGDAGAGEETCEQWLFNEAPRALRLKGTDHLVTLLQKLNEEGIKTAEMIRAKTAEMQEVAGAITKAAFVPKKGRTAGVQVRFEEAK